jgi:hypothetical protein
MGVFLISLTTRSLITRPFLFIEHAVNFGIKFPHPHGFGLANIN